MGKDVQGQHVVGSTPYGSGAGAAGWRCHQPTPAQHGALWCGDSVLVRPMPAQRTKGGKTTPHPLLWAALTCAPAAAVGSAPGCAAGAHDICAGAPSPAPPNRLALGAKLPISDVRVATLRRDPTSSWPGCVPQAVPVAASNAPHACHTRRILKLQQLCMQAGW
jgi:hypothetical protein